MRASRPYSMPMCHGRDVAEIHRRETVHGDENRRQLRLEAAVEFANDAIVIRMENLARTQQARSVVDTDVAGNIGQLAARDDRAGDIERPIAVDDEPRIRLLDEEGVELLRQLRRNARRTDVPRDMPFAFRGGNAEIAERARNALAGVIADQHERRWRIFARERKRRRFVRREQPIHCRAASMF